MLPRTIILRSPTVVNIAKAAKITRANIFHFANYFAIMPETSFSIGPFPEFPVRRFAISSQTWLVCLLGYALIVLALDCWAISRWQRLTLRDVAGSLGVQYGQLDAQYRYPIKDLSADSPLIGVGARPGNTIAFDTDNDRTRNLAKTDLVGLTLFQQGTGRHVIVSASADNPSRETVRGFALNWIGNLLAVVCGTLIVVRRPEPGPHRLLALLLITIGLGNELHILPNPIHDIFFRFGYPFVVLAGFQLFVMFALIYPPDAPPIRHRWVRRLFFLQLLSAVAMSLSNLAINSHLIPGSLMQQISQQTWSDINVNGAVFGALAVLAYSWWRSAHLTRQKMMWITLSLGMTYLSWTFIELNALFGYPLPDMALIDGMTMIRCGASVLLVYALLSRRLFDVGFAFNRALVVAVISSLLLVVFAVTEFAVDKLLHFHGRETNVIIDAAVALGVILSFHRIQHWVNHQVNHFFFHHWHEAAEKLRAFMGSATHISDANALQQKFIAAIERFGGAAGVAIYLGSPDGIFSLQHSSLTDTPAHIGANDDLVIRLRHTRAAVEDTHATAFPIFVRGAVDGFVLLGGKTNGQPYRPDEIALLKKATHQLGFDLESLRALAIQVELAAAHQAQRRIADRCEVLERIVLDKRTKRRRGIQVEHAAALRR
jgi:hypothetical protein